MSTDNNGNWIPREKPPVPEAPKPTLPSDGITERHRGRMWAIQLLFQRDFNDDGDLPKLMELFWVQEGLQKVPSNPSAKNPRLFAEELFLGTLEHLYDIDDTIISYARNWSLDRMGGIDRNILRLAIYEFYHNQAVPPVTVVNEAIDLAKEFSGDDTAKFVNGILDRALKDLKRDLRAPGGSSTSEKN